MHPLVVSEVGVDTLGTPPALISTLKIKGTVFLYNKSYTAFHQEVLVKKSGSRE